MPDFNILNNELGDRIHWKLERRLYKKEKEKDLRAIGNFLLKTGIFFMGLVKVFVVLSDLIRS